MSALGAGIGAAGNVVGGVLSYYGAKEANKMNRDLAREQMAFQRESNRDQMAFQERMSNTAFQRATADMSAAGINPILAYNLGGASTPGGSTSGGSSANMINEMSGVASSAADVARQFAEIKQIKSQTNLNDALKKAAQADATLKQNSAKKTTSDTVRSWVDTIGGATKDLAPWMLLLLRRAMFKF